jgi:hypothetical protein
MEEYIEQDCGRGYWREELQVREGETYLEVLNIVADIKVGIKEENPTGKWNGRSATFSPIYEISSETEFSDEDIMKTDTWLAFELSLEQKEEEKLRAIEAERVRKAQKAEQECEAIRLKELAQQEADMETYRRIKDMLDKQHISHQTE